jgi:hypothetical protein
MRYIASDKFINHISHNIDMQVLEESSFRRKAITALGISIVADALDYLAAPLFDLPVVGDIFDVLTTSLLYSITRSKISTAINTIELIPFIGDLIPTYTISTLLWISRESRKNNKTVVPYRKYKVMNKVSQRL